MAAYRALAVAALFLGLVGVVVADACSDGNLSTMCMCNATLTAWENQDCYVNSTLTLAGGVLQSAGEIIMLNNSNIYGNGSVITNSVALSRFIDTENVGGSLGYTDITIRDLTYTNTNYIEAIRTWYYNIVVYLINVTITSGRETVYSRGSNSGVYMNDSTVRSTQLWCFHSSSTVDVTVYNSAVRCDNVGFDMGTQGDIFAYNVSCRIDAVAQACIDQDRGKAEIIGGNYSGYDIKLLRQDPYNGAGYYISSVKEIGTLTITPRSTYSTQILNSDIQHLYSVNRCMNCTIYANNITRATFGTLYNVTWYYLPGQRATNFTLADTTGELLFIRGLNSARYKNPQAGNANPLSSRFDLGSDYVYISGMFDANPRVRLYYGGDDRIVWNAGLKCKPSLCANMTDDGFYYEFTPTAPGNYTLETGVGWSLFSEARDGLINNVFGSSLVFALFLVFGALGLLVALRISPLLAFLIVTPLFVGTVVAGFFGGAGYVKALIILVLSVIWGTILWNLLEK